MSQAEVLQEIRRLARRALGVTLNQGPITKKAARPSERPVEPRRDRAKDAKRKADALESMTAKQHAAFLKNRRVKEAARRSERTLERTLLDRRAAALRQA